MLVLFSSCLEVIVVVWSEVFVRCRGGFPRAKGQGKWLVDLVPEGKVKPCGVCESSLCVPVGGESAGALCGLRAR